MPPTALDLALLEHAQELHLDVRRTARRSRRGRACRRGAARSGRPCARDRAGERALSWPKSSLSRSVSGSAAQLTATNGLVARAAAARGCSARRSSLPVPLSPRTSTVARRRRRLARRPRSAPRIAGERADDVLGASRRASSSRSARFSATQRALLERLARRDARVVRRLSGLVDEVVRAFASSPRPRSRPCRTRS